MRTINRRICIKTPRRNRSWLVSELATRIPGTAIEHGSGAALRSSVDRVGLRVAGEGGADQIGRPGVVVPVHRAYVDEELPALDEARLEAEAAVGSRGDCAAGGPGVDRLARALVVPGVQRCRRIGEREGIVAIGPAHQHAASAVRNGRVAELKREEKVIRTG